MSTLREAAEQLGVREAQLHVEERGAKQGVFEIKDRNGALIAVVPALDETPEGIAKARAVAYRLAVSPELEALAVQIAHGPADGESYEAFGVRIMRTAEPIAKGAVFPS